MLGCDTDLYMSFFGEMFTKVSDDRGQLDGFGPGTEHKQ
jgi:hypothetical protein